LLCPALLYFTLLRLDCQAASTTVAHTPVAKVALMAIVQARCLLLHTILPQGRKREHFKKSLTFRVLLLTIRKKKYFSKSIKLASYLGKISVPEREKLLGLTDVI